VGPLFRAALIRPQTAFRFQSIKINLRKRKIKARPYSSAGTSKTTASSGRGMVMGFPESP
jgi:hypothetical protein